jgi:hypothetical protein
MKRKTILSIFAAVVVLLAAASEAKAWYAYHYSYGGGHRGGYGAAGGYRYGGYHYGGYGGARYGYVRRW